MASEHQYRMVCSKCGRGFSANEHVEFLMHVEACCDDDAPCCEAGEIVAAMEELEEGGNAIPYAIPVNTGIAGVRWVSGVLRRSDSKGVDFKVEDLGEGPTRLDALRNALAEKRRREA